MQNKFRKRGREYVRSMVRERDKFTCQECGFVRTEKEVNKHNDKIKGLKGRIKNLDVHHVDGMCGKKSKGYDKLEDMDVLITLCHRCHYNRHDRSVGIDNYYGRADTKKSVGYCNRCGIKSKDEICARCSHEMELFTHKT